MRSGTRLLFLPESPRTRAVASSAISVRKALSSVSRRTAVIVQTPVAEMRTGIPASECPVRIGFAEWPDSSRIGADLASIISPKPQGPRTLARPKPRRPGFFGKLLRSLTVAACRKLEPFLSSSTGSGAERWRKVGARGNKAWQGTTGGLTCCLEKRKEIRNCRSHRPEWHMLGLGCLPSVGTVTRRHLHNRVGPSLRETGHNGQFPPEFRPEPK